MSQQELIVDDSFYIPLENDQMRALRKPKEPKFWDTCIINVTAATKMLQHAIQGVVDGKQRGGMSVEVMGLLIGKPTENNSIIITDCLQLPIEGMENRIEAAEEVKIFIAEAVDALELKRGDRILGWYHSHPFELLTYSHCHLSQTDVQTQQAFQNLTPWWTAIVIDPIRSLTLNSFELGAYRCLPPGINADDGVAPDGKVWSSIPQLKQQWGVAPHRYYSLKTKYWISSHAAKIFHRTTGYANWVEPLLQHSFKNYTKYQEELSNINTNLHFLNQHMNQNNKITKRDTTTYVSSKHNDLGPLKHDSHNENDRIHNNGGFHEVEMKPFPELVAAVDATMCHTIECHCSSWLMPKLLQFAAVSVDEFQNDNKNNTTTTATTSTTTTTSSVPQAMSPSSAMSE